MVFVHGNDCRVLSREPLVLSLSFSGLPWDQAFLR